MYSFYNNTQASKEFQIGRNYFSLCFLHGRVVDPSRQWKMDRIAINEVRIAINEVKRT